MRVAIIAEVYLPKIDGVVHRTIRLIEQLVRADDEVIVVCPRAGSGARSPVPVVEFRSFPFVAYPEYRIGLPNRRLVQAIREFNPDVLHYINPFAFGFRCYDLLERAGVAIPCVFSFHTLYGEFVKQYGLLKPLSHTLWWLMREYHNCADANITVSTVMQKDLVERGFQRVEFWPPAVDNTLFCPQRKNPAMRSMLANGRIEKPLLLTVSRLAPEKNVGFLGDVVRQIPGSSFAVVGDGPQRAALQRGFSNLPDVNFVGYLQGKKLAEAYASADVFLYASETETMGNVILEAMASGCAVVAPRAGGIPSLVQHGETGMLFTPGNLQEAVAWTRSLLADGTLRKRMGESARKVVEVQNWQTSIERVRQLYQKTIDEHDLFTGETRRRRLARALVYALVLGFRSVSLGVRRRTLVAPSITVKTG